MSTAAETSAPVKTVLDPVTGEQVSKNELKRRERRRKKEQEQEKKRDEATPEDLAKLEAAADALQYHETRSRAMRKAFDDGEFNPWPHYFETNTNVDRFVAEYNDEPLIKEAGSKLEDRDIRLIGRVMFKRERGAKLAFFTIWGTTENVQILLSKGEYVADNFDLVRKNINRGDIIGVCGHPGRSQKEGLTLYATEIQLLSPCLHMMPKGLNPFKDPELRFRQRYLDFILNPESRRRIIVRSQVFSIFRRILGEEGFMEVETPIFNVVKGGATAKPFITHYNALGQDVFLRIAPELALKQLLVGQFEKVFEMGKSFRNESIDQTHNPEFTTMECYAVGWDYSKMMDLTEKLISTVVKEVTGGYVVEYTGPKGTYTINFEPPWDKVDMMEKIMENIGTIPGKLASEEAFEFVKAKLEELRIEVAPPLTMARMLDALCEEFIESKIINPTFVINHPVIMSPLAKYHRSNPELTERFELHTAAFELANAYTEMNNPLAQRDNFVAQLRDKDVGDDEAMDMDEIFLEALEHGLPPAGGLGIGMDRLVMIVTNSSNIKEVQTFSLCRTGKEGGSTGTASADAPITGVAPETGATGVTE